MLDKLKLYVIGALLAVKAVLVGLLKWRTHQRDAARSDAEREKRNRKSTERQQERSNDVDEARKEQEEDNKEARDEDAGDDDSGGLSNDRLRDED